METILNIVILLVAFAFAVGTTIIVAERKEKKRDRAEPGKFDKQGVAPYTDGDNT